MTISVRITGVVFSPAGIQFPIGSNQTLSDDYGASIIAAGLGTANTPVLYPPQSSPVFEPYPTGTLAQMMAANPVAGQRFHTTDTYVINGAVSPVGNDWIGDGTVWRPRGYQRVLADTALLTGALQVGDQVIKTLTIPAGLLFMQRFILESTTAKTGGTDAMNQMTIRLGPLGTLGDSNLGTTAATILPAAKRSVGFGCVYECTGTNTVIKRGSNGSIDNPSFGGVAVANAVDSVLTLAGANLQTTAQLLTFSASMNAATTDSPQISSVYLTLIP